MAGSLPLRLGLALMAVLALTPAVSAFSLWKVQADPTSLQVKSFDTHRSAPKMTVNLPLRLEEAKHIIKSFESLPSCSKIATAALMHSCSSPHQSSQRDTNYASHTSDVLKAYGARLAVCELLEADEANTLIPEECQAFVPSPQSAKKPTMAGFVGEDGLSEPTLVYPAYDELTKQNLDRCVSGLAQEPQSWSSYSNSKQNAVVICHSVQGELQLERSVKTYEKIINSFGGIVEHHQEMAQAYEAQLSEVRSAAKELVSYLQQQWIKMTADVSDLTKALHEQLLWVLHDASDATQSSLQNVNQATSNLNQDVASILQQVTNVGKQAAFAGNYVDEHLMQQLGRAFHELGLQQDLVQRNNDALKFVTSGLVDTMSQVNRTNDQLATTEIFAHNIRDQLHQANEDVEKFNQNIGYLANIVSYGWAGVIGKVSVFIVVVTVVTLFTFGFWERFVDLSFLGNCGTALSTGIGFGFTCAYYIDPTTIFQNSSNEFFENSFTAHKHVLIGLSIGIIGTIFITTIYAAITRHFASKPYDPASPPLEVKMHSVAAV